MLYLSKCYEIWNEEALEAGETDDRGFEFQGELFTFRELIDELRRKWHGGELSTTGKPDRNTWVTISIDDWVDSGGAHTVFTLHLDSINNNDRAERYWVKALQYAFSKGRP